MRNHYIDKSFILLVKSYIGREIFEKYSGVTENSNYKFTHKITEIHINLVGTLESQMYLQLAVQLFSNTILGSSILWRKKN